MEGYDTVEVDYERLERRGEIAAMNAEDAEYEAHLAHDPKLDWLHCDNCREFYDGLHDPRSI